MAKYPGDGADADKFCFSTDLVTGMLLRSYIITHQIWPRPVEIALSPEKNRPRRPLTDLRGWRHPLQRRDWFETGLNNPTGLLEEEINPLASSQFGSHSWASPSVPVTRKSSCVARNRIWEDGTASGNPTSRTKGRRFQVKGPKKVSVGSLGSIPPVGKEDGRGVATAMRRRLYQSLFWDACPCIHSDGSQKIRRHPFCLKIH
jgi:hypothetical protein